MFYDLHVHSALSPCADNDMTPATIAGFLALSSAEVISVTDHNSALNLPAAKIACENYGIKLLPGMEVNTAEEIHILCYFPSVEAALEMGEKIYQTLPDIHPDPSIWGEQFVFDSNDRVLAKPDKLLAFACGFDIYTVKALTESMGGVTVPAHVDRDSYSLLSVLGFLPDDLSFFAAEFVNPHKYDEYRLKHLLPDGLRTLFSSDAHNLARLTREPLPKLEWDNPLMKLIEKL
ncbi:MAG: PHP domain-containing protein [Oscillospiraceae bacterium]|nr:PHP domain-containing protein [Oscillospiraceae bacterium]